jgi:DNA-binding MarR family transcriptional regulator
MPKPRTDGAPASANDYSIARLRVAASPLFLRPAEVQRGVELLLLGHSQLMRAADEVLRDAGIGRAHARMLGHVVRWPGIAMGDLIDLTGTTKQALTRVARELDAKGLIDTVPGLRDRRRRELTATVEGRALAARIDAAYAAAIAEAYGVSGRESVSGFWQVLEGLVPVALRTRFAEWERRR